MLMLVVIPPAVNSIGKFKNLFPAQCSLGTFDPNNGSLTFQTTKLGIIAVIAPRATALPYSNWYCCPIGDGSGHSVALHLTAGPLEAPVKVSGRKCAHQLVNLAHFSFPLHCTAGFVVEQDILTLLSKKNCLHSPFLCHSEVAMD